MLSNSYMVMKKGRISSSLAYMCYTIMYNYKNCEWGVMLYEIAYFKFL